MSGSVTPAQAAQWMNEAADEATQALRSRIEQLELELAEARAEANAAWDKCEERRLEAVAEKALAADLYGRLEYADQFIRTEMGGLRNPERRRVLDAYRKERGL